MEEDRILKNGAIYIDGDTIADLGPTEKITRNWRAEEIIDGTNRIIMPGFVNCHTHTDVYLTRTYGLDEHAAIEYFRIFKWPRAMAMTPEDYYVSSIVGYAENIRSGVTLAVDNYYGTKDMNLDGVPIAAGELGMRSILVKGYHDYPYLLPDQFIEQTEGLEKKYSGFIEEWNGKFDGRIKTWVGPVNMLYCTPESVTKLHELASRKDVGLHSHVSEVKKGVDTIRQRHGKGYVELIHSIGALTPRFQSAHCVWIDDNEIQLLAKTGAPAIHNPVSNMYLASGIPPILKMRNAGVTIALGTDGRLDMFTAMKTAMGLQKAITRDPKSLTAKEVLRMATIGGAIACGLQDEIGSLKVGKKADCIVIDSRSTVAVPVYDPVLAIAYFLGPENLEHVIIDGQLVMKNRKLTRVDEHAAIDRAQQASQDLDERMKEFQR